MTGQCAYQLTTERLAETTLYGDVSVHAPDTTGLQRFRHRLWVAQFGRCAYCAQPLSARRCGRGFHQVTLDHVRPKKHGWSRQDNAVLAHRLCNSRKGSRAPHACESLFLDVTMDIARGLSAVRIAAVLGYAEEGVRP